MRNSWTLMLSVAGALGVLLPAQELPAVSGVEKQPLVSQVRRLVEALEFAGSPLSSGERSNLDAGFELADPEAVATIQRVLAPRVLLLVHINPESRVTLARGPAAAELVQHGWRAFLVRIHNEAGVTAPLRLRSPEAGPMHKPSSGAPEPPVSVTPGQAAERWMEIALESRPPMAAALSGLELEYALIEIYARDAGKREARIAADVGQGTQDIGFRNEAAVLFTCRAPVEVVLEVRDEDGSPTTGWFIFRDRQGRILPAPSRRRAPDFFFHAQVYRAHGEPVLLPPGTYDVESGRGPEYHRDRRELVVPEGVTRVTESFRLRRWIHPRAAGWFSGDHHVHAAGCAHYESPAQGVAPADMMRHLVGEDLSVGCVLSWGPCWYHQKSFFEGRVHPLSTKNHLLRYDVEVSGFPSQHSGHLCLLRLKEDDYPGTTRIEEWPSWDLPILRWAKSQGGVAGFSHSGFGLEIRSRELPSDEMPAFDGIGANEYIVDVVHDAVDFISAVDTPWPWELNIWYHTLNCGFRTRISGETDFPCIYGQRVGLGRVYCRLEGGLDFDRWCDALKDGRSYVGDGSSHVLDFTVAGIEAGTKGSEVRLDAPGTVKVAAKAAALLAIEPDTRIAALSADEKPYWHLERARIGSSRKVPVEVLVNGRPAARTEITADGSLSTLGWDIEIKDSSWIALRILPSSHTNPVFVLVGDRPVRASKRSAQWCLKAVDQCWSQKERRIRTAEKPAARLAYDAAREAYRRILSEIRE